ERDGRFFAKERQEEEDADRGGPPGASCRRPENRHELKGREQKKERGQEIDPCHDRPDGPGCRRVDGEQRRGEQRGTLPLSQAAGEKKNQDGVGGVEQDVEQMKSGRPPAGDPSVERQGGDNERPVVGRAERRAVPEMMRERRERAPRLPQKAVVDDEMQIIEDEWITD